MQDEPRKSRRSTRCCKRRVQHVDLDPQVVGEELHRIGVVRQDAADLGRGQHDVARLDLGEVVEDGVAVAEVDLATRRDPRSVNPAASSRRHIAEPTMPR